MLTCLCHIKKFVLRVVQRQVYDRVYTKLPHIFFFIFSVFIPKNSKLFFNQSFYQIVHEIITN